jgi:hypothetical protein
MKRVGWLIIAVVLAAGCSVRNTTIHTEDDVVVVSFYLELKKD